MDTPDNRGELRYTIYHAGMNLFYRGSRGKGRGSDVRWSDSLRAAYFTTEEVAQQIAWRFEGTSIRTNYEMYESGLSVKFFFPEA